LWAIKIGGRYGVVTTGEYWVKPLTKANQACLDEGDRDRFGGIVASGLGVLEIHGSDGDGALDGTEIDAARMSTDIGKRMAVAAAKLVRGTEIDVVVLGCAGMEGMEEAITFGVREIGRETKVVDCVRAAIELIVEEFAGQPQMDVNSG
jgi:Asp/Glu/hydantoin racemase